MSNTMIIETDTYDDIELAFDEVDYDTAVDFWHDTNATVIATKIVISKNMKTPAYLAKYRDEEDYPENNKKLKYTMWNKQDGKAHNKYIVRNKKHTDLTDIIVVPQFDNYLVIDVDSKEELDMISEWGFPCETALHTRSLRKKLPHFIVKYAGPPLHKWLGKEHGRDIDVLTDSVFETVGAKLYGEHLYTLTKPDICRLLGIDQATLKTTDPVGERRQNILDGVKPTPYVNTQQPKVKSGQVIGNIEPLTKGVKVFTDDNELIPLGILNEILRYINFASIDNYSEWLSFTFAVANNIPNNTDPNSYLNMYISHSQKFPSYKPEYDGENRDVFEGVIQNSMARKGQKKITSRTIWKKLKDDNYDMWKTLAFHKDRELDAREFSELTFEEGCKVFNEHIGFVKNGNSPVYIEWNGQINDFVVYTKDKLIDTYSNFATKDKEGNLKPDFIKQWVKWIGKRTYNRQTFAPPPMTVPYNCFNYFTGFAVDKVYDYDEDVNKLTKAQLEDELSFLLNHLRLLSGEDQTDTVYDFQLKYFAHMIKFPAKLPRTMILWVSLPGTGKNQMLNFFRNIIGEIYFASSEKTDDFCGKFNDMLSHKLLVNLNEIEGAYEVMKNIKTIITEKTVGTTKKFCETVILPNFVRIIATTNRKYSIPIEEGDRRTTVIRCSSKIVDSTPEEKAEYFTTLAEQIDDIYYQKCFARYCREFVDVEEDYNFETQRPITQEWLIMKRQNAPITHRFFQFLYEMGNTDKPYNKGQLTRLYNVDFVQEYKETKASMSNVKFANMLEEFVINQTDSDGKLLDTPSMDFLERNPQKFIECYKTDRYKYVILKDRLRDWLIKNKYQFDEPENEEDAYFETDDE